MAIVQKQAPPATGARAIGMALRDLRGKPDPKALLGGAQINLSVPLPVYRLGLDELDESGGLQNAKQVGWRYLMEGSAEGSVGYADVRETEGGGSKFTSVSHNRNADRLSEAAHLAQKVAEDLPDDCEARILDVPALYISAVWLNCATPVFIPYIHPKKLTGGQGKIQVEANFLQELAEAAQEAKQLFRDKPSVPPEER